MEDYASYLTRGTMASPPEAAEQQRATAGMRSTFNAGGSLHVWASYLAKGPREADKSKKRGMTEDEKREAKRLKREAKKRSKMVRWRAIALLLCRWLIVPPFLAQTPEQIKMSEFKSKLQEYSGSPDSQICVHYMKNDRRQEINIHIYKSET